MGAHLRPRSSQSRRPADVVTLKWDKHAPMHHRLLSPSQMMPEGPPGRRARGRDLFCLIALDVCIVTAQFHYIWKGLGGSWRAVRWPSGLTWVYQCHWELCGLHGFLEAKNIVFWLRSMHRYNHYTVSRKITPWNAETFRAVWFLICVNSKV